MDTDEVLGILEAVGQDDPIPDFTEGLFLNIGTRSRRLLNNDPEAVSAVQGFMDSLEHFARFGAERPQWHLGRSATFSSRERAHSPSL
jgi:hypothetical protein